MDVSEKLSGLLRTLYEAAAEPQHWTLFVQAMLRETGADAGFVIALGDDQIPALYSQIGDSEESLQNYQQYFYKHDLIMTRFRQAAREQGSWIGARNSVLSDEEFDCSEFYNDYMRPMNLYHQAGATIAGIGSYPLAGITLVRSHAAGYFDPESISLLHLISPHLKQACLLHEKLNAMKAESALLGQALEATGIACLAVSDTGIVQGRTAAAENILRQSDGLLVVAGRLRAEETHNDAALQGLLQRACQTGSGNRRSAKPGRSPGGEIAIQRRSCKEPLQVAVSPFHSNELFMESKPAALVFIVDPEIKVPSRASLLRRIYGLTPAEARLCDLLVQGFNVKSSAERLRITEASARFVLKRVFEKTAVNSQSGLIRLVLSLPILPSDT